MNAFASNASLILLPKKIEGPIGDTDIIITTLRDTGLIGVSLENNPDSFLVGESFLDLIAFMGCAPNIRLAPEDDAETFTHLRLHSSADTITAFTSDHSHAPHCPNCKKPEKNWRETISSETLICSNCGTASPPWHYNWRRSAGFGHYFIEITEIYPQEAIPQESLLSALRDSCGFDWNYFYHYP